MGLDIRAFTLKEKVGDSYEDEDGYELDYDVYIHDSDWDYQQGDLQKGAYRVEYCNDSFRCGYGTWSHHRETLAGLSNYPEWIGLVDNEGIAYWCKRFPRQSYIINSGEVKTFTDLPLLPLIHFTDCDGFICNEVCNHIWGDLQHLEVPDELLPLKAMFKWCFENNGVIQFS